MAHKKAAGSAKNLRDSNPKFRGLKLAGGQSALAGNIIIRQTGDRYMCGNNTYKGKDFTIHAKVDGVVSFRKKRFTRFDGRRYVKTVVDVLPEGVDAPETQGNASKKATVASKAQKKSVKKTTTKQSTTKQTGSKTTSAKATKGNETKAAKKSPAKSPTKAGSGDDLTKIEGIGPVIQKLLHENGISSFEDLSSTKVGVLRDILADNDLAMHEPMPWKKQATLAKNESWDELKEYQDELQAGRE